MRLRVEDVLAEIPGWENAAYRPLRGGLTNRSWKVRKDDRRGVLKFDEAPRGAPFATRPEEARVQRAAAAAGLAPRVLFANRSVYLTEFVDGEIWTPRRVRDADSLQKLAVALRQLHVLPLSGRLFDAPAAARHYRSQIVGAQDPAVIGRCVAIVERHSGPGNLCCCHNDLVAANLISAPQLLFLDWEYACDNDPFFDLATVVEHHELSESLAGVLLDAYFDGDGRCRQSQLDVQRRLYLALLWLWQAARSDTDQAELERIAARITSDF